MNTTDFNNYDLEDSNEEFEKVKLKRRSEEEINYDEDNKLKIKKNKNITDDEEESDTYDLDDDEAEKAEKAEEESNEKPVENKKNNKNIIQTNERINDIRNLLSIPEDCKIEGNVNYKGNAAVSGEIKGNLIIKGTLAISDCKINGQITCNKLSIVGGENIVSDGITAKEITIGAKLTGSVNTDWLDIQRNGVVIGDLNIVSGQIEGAVRGNITAENRVKLNGDAKIKGNIKATQLVISEDVSIEGSCIQTCNDVIDDSIFN